MEILICDDRDPKTIADALEHLNADAPAHNLHQLSGDDLGSELNQLFGYVRGLLEGQEVAPADTDAFNGFDLILLDYGLTALNNAGIRLTADHVAGYLRAFCDAPYIVSLNKLPTVDFDLKYLLGDFDSRADLALNTDHLREPGLWNGRPPLGAFCPWYWPTLEGVAQRRREQVEIVSQNLEASILETLAFPDEVIPLLSSQAVAFLSPEAEDEPGAQDVRRTTFWDHFRFSNRTLPRNDRAQLAQVFGGDIEQDVCPASEEFRQIVSRVVAGELEFWFRRDILGPQRLLIDAPHLQSRYPFGTGNNQQDAQAWLGTTNRQEAAPFGLDQELLDAAPAPPQAAVTPWVEGVAFWLPLWEDCQALHAMLERRPRNRELVFCEDTRRFKSRTGPNAPRRFETELGKGIDVRFVEGLGGINYSPASLFAR